MVVVLGSWNKKKEGQIPAWIVKRMKGRHKIVTSLIQVAGNEKDQDAAGARKKG